MLERRGFVGALLGAGAVPMLLDRPVSVPLPDQPWDMSWMDRLKGKHKQVFDYNDLESLHVVRNWLDAHETVYGLKYPSVNAIVGAAGRGFPVNAGDALYQKYPIGEQWKVNDPDTGKPALRNPYMEGGAPFIGAGVRPLQARGTIFWQCNNALLRLSGRLGKAVNRPEAEVYQDLRAGLNPGVILVPAHTMLLGLVQERGCAYQSL